MVLHHVPLFLQTAPHIKANRRREMEEKVERFALPETLGRAAKLVSDKGASNWLTAVPLECHGFVLHKEAFQDALCLRYGWLPEKLLTRCECGTTFSINHAVNCPNGAFPTLRHNEGEGFHREASCQGLSRYNP